MISRLLAWYFKHKGWKIEGNGISPGIKKAVVIGAPHTSNWDFVYGIAAIHLFGLRLNYLAKKELFVWPIKKLFTGTGGIPVERSKNTRMVDMIISMFSKADRFILIIPVEGTRKRVDKIKTGFYHVALGAGVPIIMGYIDYRQKRAGFSEPYHPSGNRNKDAAVIKKFYMDKNGKNPDLFNPDAFKLDEI